MIEYIVMELLVILVDVVWFHWSYQQDQNITVISALEVSTSAQQADLPRLLSIMLLKCLFCIRNLPLSSHSCSLAEDFPLCIFLNHVTPIGAYSSPFFQAIAF